MTPSEAAIGTLEILWLARPRHLATQLGMHVFGPWNDLDVWQVRLEILAVFPIRRCDITTSYIHDNDVLYHIGQPGMGQAAGVPACQQQSDIIRMPLIPCVPRRAS